MTAEKLYLAGSVFGGVVKIGISTNPRRRITQLTHGCPFEIEVFSVLHPKDAAKSEARLTQLLAEHRARGEWFYLSGPVASVVRVAQQQRQIEPVIAEAEAQAKCEWNVGYEVSCLDSGPFRYCAFCGASNLLASRMVTGMVTGQAASICENCIEECRAALSLSSSNDAKPEYFGRQLDEARRDRAVMALEERKANGRSESH